VINWLRDPLVTFLLAGAVIFAFTQWFAEEDIPYAIELREQDLERLNDQWRMQMRRPASEQELAGLIEQFVKEEVYYREAQRLELDRNDTIVRRRMVQKLTFLTEDIATAKPLVEAELRAFYNDNLAQYRVPERYSFRHRYFSSDRREDAQTDATIALQQPDQNGDPFMLQREYARRSQREVGDLFGRDFASELVKLDASTTWQGPVRSAYGWHAVQLTTKQEAAVEPFERVRERVSTDAQQAARKAANEAYYKELRARYDVAYPSIENDVAG
jgi:peptidyl-prolyl cis-trans isomerase C